MTDRPTDRQTDRPGVIVTVTVFSCNTQICWFVFVMKATTYSLKNHAIVKQVLFFSFSVKRYYIIIFFFSERKKCARVSIVSRR